MTSTSVNNPFHLPGTNMNGYFFNLKDPSFGFISKLKFLIILTYTITFLTQTFTNNSFMTALTKYIPRHFLGPSPNPCKPYLAGFSNLSGINWSGFSQTLGFLFIEMTSIITLVYTMSFNEKKIYSSRNMIAV